MNEKFFDLKQEKQDRIINGCLKIFALNGYDHAGTDDMVREAGISKGLLFHYFGSKAGVYAFVHDYAVRYLCMEMDSVKSRKITDPFLLLKESQQTIFSVLRGYPYLQLFLMKAAGETNEEALLVSASSDARLRNLMRELSLMIDFSGMPEELRAPRFWKMADYLIMGMFEERFKDNGDALDELAQDYMSTLGAFVMMLRP